MNKLLVFIFAGGIRMYQLLLSPFFGGQCRFFPSCSEYAREAVETQGVFTGGIKTVTRLLRCHPFSSGGHDPVSK